MTEKCAECGEPFVPNKPWQKYCSRECQALWHARDKREMRQAWRERDRQQQPEQAS
jgi:hypothetical protein